MQVVHSINEVPIRLTEERWEHIMSNKPYMARYNERVLDAIANPAWVLHGYSGSLVAVVPVGKKQYLHVIYKELNQDDGFVITAYIAHKYNRRKII